MTRLVPWEEARDRVRDGVQPLAPVDCPTLDAHGLALAQPVTARLAMPPFDNSAMDGFTVRAADTSGASEEHPVELEVSGHQAAGSTGATVQPGTAVRTMTGAPIPEGGDAVVPVEHTDLWDAATRRARPTDGPVRIHRPAREGQNIRRAGESVPLGARCLEPGRLLRAQEISLLLSINVGLVNVHPRPRVGVLSTGDEVLEPGQPIRPGAIPDSNRPGLLRRISEVGCEPVDLGLVPDSAEILRAHIRNRIADVDFLLTSGGVSVGDHDHTRDVLESLGDVSAYPVAVKPGKPQVFGHIDDTPVFGLPGNPVSALVVFDVFVLPGLRRRAGRSDLVSPTFPAILAAPIRRRPGRTEFVRVTLSVRDDTWMATPTGPQGSGILRSMTDANGYAIIPAEADSLPAGSRVICQPFIRG